jgi:hypothetical protein
MSHVAEKINDVKKRKDTVEKYAEGKAKINVMLVELSAYYIRFTNYDIFLIFRHGISKKFTRGVQEVMFVELFSKLLTIFRCPYS